MENLPTFKFPDQLPDEDPKVYLKEFARNVDDSWNEIRQRMNWALERVHITTETAGVLDRDGTRSMVYELIPPKARKNTDGNFRIHLVPNGVNFDFHIQIRVAGTWIDGIVVDSSGKLDMKAHRIDNISDLNITSAEEVTISGGSVTITQAHVRVLNEGGAADDDLDTINGGKSGDILFLLPANDAQTVRLRHAVGNIFLKHQTAEQSYSFNSPSGSSGTFYKGGFYLWPSADANLDQAGTTITLGTASVSYAAHASLVAAAPGTATGGSGAVTIVVSGTGIDDNQNRTPGDSEVLVADITALSTNQYLETIKKWLGQITYTLTVGATGHTAFAADFNYGYSKYEDLGNTDFNVALLECVGRAGANDTGFNIRLFHHNTADWTYAATGFVPGPTAGDASELANQNTLHGVENNLANGEPIAFKVANLNQDIMGRNGEGLIVEITTTANKAVETMDIHIGVHAAPNFSYMATTKQHLIFMKHGPNWLEL